jgi:hypothetical protein
MGRGIKAFKIGLFWTHSVAGIHSLKQLTGDKMKHLFLPSRMWFNCPSVPHALDEKFVVQC